MCVSAAYVSEHIGPSFFVVNLCESICFREEMCVRVCVCVLDKERVCCPVAVSFRVSAQFSPESLVYQQAGSMEQHIDLVIRVSNSHGKAVCSLLP